jgi:hypothetical protein
MTEPPATPTLSTEPSAETPSAEPTLDPPPVATLRIGSHSYVGTIGGYTWKDHGDAAPWLPARALDAIKVATRARLTVVIEGVAIDHWTAAMARASDTRGDALTGLGEGARTISIVGPRSGSWVISVAVQYAHGLGDGAYYWSLVVR